MDDKILFSDDKIDLRAATLQLRADGIMHIDLKLVDEFSLDDVLEVLANISKIGNGKAFPNMVTIKNYISISKEAREMSASLAGNLYTVSDAFVINSLPLKLIGNFYISYNKPVKPTRIFNSEEKAIVWLKTFL